MARDVSQEHIYEKKTKVPVTYNSLACILLSFLKDLLPCFWTHLLYVIFLLLRADSQLNGLLTRHSCLDDTLQKVMCKYSFLFALLDIIELQTTYKSRLCIYNNRSFGFETQVEFWNCTLRDLYHRYVSALYRGILKNKLLCLSGRQFGH